MNEVTFAELNLEKVKALHQRSRDEKYGGIWFCSHCSHLLGHGRLQEWPCPTIVAANCWPAKGEE